MKFPLLRTIPALSQNVSPSSSPMFTRRISIRYLAVAFACSIAAATSVFAETATTVPVGYMTYTLTGGGTNNAIGVPLLDTEAFSGPSTTVEAKAKFLCRSKPSAHSRP
jgi:hypothetical protein